MNLQVDRSLASISRRAFLKTTALAGLSPLAFARANQDEDKPKNGRLFVFVGEDDMNPEPTDPAMTGMFAIDPESGLRKRIATIKEAGFFTSISPKGDTVATSRFDLKEPGVWMFEPGRDKEPRRIIDKRTAHFHPPLWSADGRRLLASFPIKKRENEAAFETFTFRSDGTGLEKLPIAETDIAVAWSPDNRSLLVAAAKDRHEFPPGYMFWPIEFVKVNGTGRRRLVAAEVDRQISDLAFSPDGRTFAYYDTRSQAGRGIDSRLWIVDLENGKRRRC